MRPSPKRLARCTRGATAVEYGFILALIVVVLIVAVRLLGSTNADTWGQVNREVSRAR